MIKYTKYLCKKNVYDIYDIHGIIFLLDKWYAAKYHHNLNGKGDFYTILCGYNQSYRFPERIFFEHFYTQVQIREKVINELLNI